MPSVLPTFLGLRIVIYPNDHRPPHVHVIGPQEQARFELVCDSGQVRLMSCVGLDLKRVRRIASHLEVNIRRLCGEWERIHGD